MLLKPSAVKRPVRPSPHVKDTQADPPSKRPVSQAYTAFHLAQSSFKLELPDCFH